MGIIYAKISRVLTDQLDSLTFLNFVMLFLMKVFRRSARLSWNAQLSFLLSLILQVSTYITTIPLGSTSSAALAISYLASHTLYYTIISYFISIVCSLIWEIINFSETYTMSLMLKSVILTYMVHSQKQIYKKSKLSYFLIIF